MLSRLPGASWTDVPEPPDVDRALECMQHDPSASAVLDLSMLPHDQKLALVDRALRRIRAMRRQGRPHWVLLDEAHYLLHEGGIGADAVGLGDRGFCVVTYRPRWLRASVAAALDMCIFARTTNKEELVYVRAMLAGHRDAETVSGTLPYLSPHFRFDR